MSHRANIANESVTNLVLEPQIVELYAESTEERFYEEQAGIQSEGLLFIF